MLIAQVSDIHAAPDNDHLARFDRVLGWLAQLQPDVLVLSGDLTDDGWLEGYRQIAARLGKVPYASLILPGNSDDRRLMRSVWGENAWAKDACDGALHIASGHVHRPIAGMFAGIPAHICASVCPANPVCFGTERVPPAEDAPGLMIHRYMNSVLTSHHVRV
ncbi:metallophosphoesterase [Leclercia sp. Marseille-Q4284]|uniref:metallophosphoesterase n=1 Tax=Leclercia sp. Marseille-Q4284 TaxID=2866582 RepID=UPI001CE44A0A|nr:metallophosphoesterase [Leclercia sp. Marseille-Q4284]